MALKRRAETCQPTSAKFLPLMNVADLILAYVPLPTLPYYLTHYVRGATPLSTQPVVVSVILAYLATIFAIRELLKNHQPYRLQFLFQAHNVILSSGSALLLVLMLEEILPIFWKHGLFYALCNTRAWTEVRVLSFLKDRTLTCFFAAARVLLHYQLLFQVYGAHRHHFSRAQEKTSRFGHPPCR